MNIGSISQNAFREQPVTIEEFLVNEKYLGKSTDCGRLIFPFWATMFNNCFNDENFDCKNILLTGSCGVGKTVFSALSACYIFYVMSCMKKPDYMCGGVVTPKIMFARISEQQDTAFNLVKGMMATSEYFTDVLHIDLDSNDKISCVVNGVEISVESIKLNRTHFIASNKKISSSNVFNYVRFSPTAYKYENELVDKMMLEFDKCCIAHNVPNLNILESDLYDTEYLHKEFDRFMKLDACGKYCEVSYPQWEIIPPNKFSTEKFTIAYNNYGVRIIDSLLDLRYFGDSDVKLLQVPANLKQAFQLNMIDAFRKIVGIDICKRVVIECLDIQSALTHLGDTPNLFNARIYRANSTTSYAKFHGQITNIETGKEVKSFIIDDIVANDWVAEYEILDVKM